MLRPDGGPAPLVVRVEVATEEPASGDQVAGRLVAQIKETLGVDATVEPLARDTLPRAGYKATRVIDPR